jgi:Leucine-rich repeat (LRR) protein
LCSALPVSLLTQTLTSSFSSSDGKSYAYSTLNLEEKEIQELDDLLKPYVHLSNLTLSKNDIRDVSCVADLPNLLSFAASGCAINSLDFMAASPQALQYLQVSCN